MRAAICILFVMTVLSAAQAGEGDWPKWLGPNGDGISREKGLLDKWPEGGLKKLWSASVGKGYGSPVAVDGKVYVLATISGNDTLTAVDAEKGQVLWSDSGKGTWTGDHPNARTTPTIEGDRVYTLGGGGELVCRELAGGKKVWTLEVLKEAGSTKNLKWGVASSPTIVGDLIYVQSGDGGSIALAVNKKDGKVAWKSEEKGMASYATVLPVDLKTSAQVVVFAGKRLVGMDAATGKTLWTAPWTTSWDVHAATPLFRDGHLFITSGYNHGCMMLKYSDGKAEKTWEKKDPHCKHVTPILDGEYLYANSEGTLVCLRWPDGKEQWKSGEPGLGIGGSFVRNGDKLYALTENGQLAFIQATPEACKVLGKMPLFRGGDNWTTPLIYRGRLYVKGGNELVCLDIKAQ